MAESGCGEGVHRDYFHGFQEGLAGAHTAVGQQVMNSPVVTGMVPDTLGPASATSDASKACVHEGQENSMVYE